MKKMINQPEHFVDEMLEGIYSAHPGALKYTGDDLRCLIKANPTKNNKVALVTGGGSGHLPVFLGYVGEGMLDGCAVGGVFQSPSAEQILKVTQGVDQGAGVLYIFGNYTGDIINFDMAGEMADLEGIRTATVLGADDVASATPDRADKRRGVAGIFFVYKTAGAAAEAGLPLEEVQRIAQKTAEATRSMGVALSPCIIPEVGYPSFNLAEDEMEIGMGIHGEPGIKRGKLQTADAIVDQMLPRIIEDMPYRAGDEVAVLVNGLGSTPKEELYILYRRVHQMLREKGLKIFHVYVGEYATAMEMAGASISLCKLDEELKRYLAKPACTPFFMQLQLQEA